MSTEKTIRTDALLNLTPDLATLSTCNERSLGIAVLRNRPRVESTLHGIGLAATQPSPESEIELVDTELLPKRPKGSIDKKSHYPVISKAELSKKLRTAPIASPRDLWGEMVCFPFLKNMTRVGRVGLISEDDMACVFYGEGDEDLKWFSFEELQKYNPELFLNYPFTR